MRFTFPLHSATIQRESTTRDDRQALARCAQRFSPIGGAKSNFHNGKEHWRQLPGQLIQIPFPGGIDRSDKP